MESNPRLAAMIKHFLRSEGDEKEFAYEEISYRSRNTDEKKMRQDKNLYARMMSDKSLTAEQKEFFKREVWGI